MRQTIDQSESSGIKIMDKLKQYPQKVNKILGRIFKRIGLEGLIKTENDNYWRIKEYSKLNYCMPLLSSNDAFSIGKKLAFDIPKDQLKKLGNFLTCTSPESHKSQQINAIDFLVPDGTYIVAASDGVVIEIVENNNEWGDDPSFGGKANYITIEHDYPGIGIKEFSQYVHLSPLSAKEMDITLGSKVYAGQIIAKVGKTGWTDRDHLHFIVFRSDIHPINEAGYKSLIVKFKENIKPKNV